MSSKSYSDMLPFKSWDVLFVTKAHRSCDRLICMIRTGMHDDVIFYCGEEEECVTSVLVVVKAESYIYLKS